MKRASYRAAVAWIAANDEAGSDDRLEAVSSYVTTLLIADIFGVDEARVGADVLRIRDRQAREEARAASRSSRDV